MKTKISGKAQAALEFLTTYGWAFLVILIMIGTLAYFGILSPSKVLPNRCNIGSEFQCLDYQISATTSGFKLRLKNTAGELIDVSSIALSSEGATAYACTVPPSMPTAWKSGETRDLSWGGCNSAAAGFAVGEKGKVLVTITYNTVASGASYAKEVKGDVFSTIT